MKIIQRISKNTSIEVDAPDLVSGYKEVSAAVEVFSAGAVCGVCGSEAQPRVRVVDECTYAEAQCKNSECRAVLAFGMHRKGNTLFPKRKDADGKYLANDGWQVWSRNA